MDSQVTALSEWQNFYVIVGSSAGALIGLQFVLIALIANMPRIKDQVQAGGAFATPTVVHFSAVLLLAAGMNAPWRGIVPVAVIWGLMGLIGTIYAITIARTMRRQTAYKPELEDWLFHAILPFVAYALLIASAWRLFFDPRTALFGAAAGALLLLIIGIHNAWDAVTYHLFANKESTDNR
jgi:hypothetical protein